ncbi:unnamed protein product [Taenia asiatica]|uniref:Uncharacterized protein n=1 Tax=Taenia asiatica TaxID=60517 RepID=A0A0R3WC33_TAEAS|nr:unnamed protein product [Taenia asiatica]
MRVTGKFGNPNYTVKEQLQVEWKSRIYCCQSQMSTSEAGLITNDQDGPEIMRAEDIHSDAMVKVLDANDLYCSCQKSFYEGSVKENLRWRFPEQRECDHPDTWTG